AIAVHRVAVIADLAGVQRAVAARGLGHTEGEPEARERPGVQARVIRHGEHPGALGLAPVVDCEGRLRLEAARERRHAGGDAGRAGAVEDGVRVVVAGAAVVAGDVRGDGARRLQRGVDVRVVGVRDAHLHHRARGDAEAPYHDVAVDAGHVVVRDGL